MRPHTIIKFNQIFSDKTRNVKEKYVNYVKDRLYTLPNNTIMKNKFKTQWVGRFNVVKFNRKGIKMCRKYIFKPECKSHSKIYLFNLDNGPEILCYMSLENWFVQSW